LSTILRALRHPLLLLLTINLTVGLLTFHNYGLSWDEPLFYDYADSIWKAYSPEAFSPGFDFESVYGRSAEDHKTRGPAYLLLARPVQQSLITLFGLDTASAWHLVNFLTFQIIGVGFFYALLLRWVGPSAAFLATALFASQPLLWGHAFINPKDTIFTAFFIAATQLGLQMIDQLAQHNPSQQTAQGNSHPQTAWRSLPLAVKLSTWPAIVFGLTISIRILAPLAGLLIGIYALIKLQKNIFNRLNLLTLAVFGITTALAMIVSWPYLWANPLTRLSEIVELMSRHPASIQVLFSGQLYPAYDLPYSYLPKLLALTLTEPVWPLFALGILLVVWKRQDWPALAPLLLWFIIPFFYVVLRRPPLSDNFRHFLFILPPIFIYAAIAIDALSTRLRHNWAVAILGALLLMPGIYANARLHPYEYTYYNSLAEGPYRAYETDYWLTCYKEAAEWAQANDPGATLHVQREPALARYYAPTLTIADLDKEPESNVQPGDLLLLSTRANMDTRSIYRSLPVVTSFGRNGAEFCIIKRNK